MQLKNFIQRSEIDPVIDENHFAIAEGTKQDILRNNDKARYILSFYIVGIVLVLFIIGTLLFIYLNTKRWDRKLKIASKTEKKNKYIKSKLFSISSTAFILNLHIVCLDIAAVVFKKKHKESVNEHFVHVLPYIVTTIDSIGAVIWVVISVLSVLISCYKKCQTCCTKCWRKITCKKICQSDKACSQLEYLGLALAILGPSASLVMHLPYVVIAYLNDPSYATSIFIYYIVTVFAIFGVLDLTYGTCQGAIINTLNKTQIEHGRRNWDNNRGNSDTTMLMSKKNENSDSEEGETLPGPIEESDDDHYFCVCVPKRVSAIRCCCACVIPIFTALLLAFAGMITAALVLIPISKAFSDVPNHLMGFYETAIVLIGAYLLYRKFLKKKPSLHSVIKDREEFIATISGKTMNQDEWKKRSKDEKLEVFYKRVVDLVANHEPKQKTQPEQLTEAQSKVTELGENQQAEGQT